MKYEVRTVSKGLAALLQHVWWVRVVLLAFSPPDIWTPLFLPPHLPASWQTPLCGPQAGPWPGMEWKTGVLAQLFLLFSPTCQLGVGS